jgi:hypothetical protein
MNSLSSSTHAGSSGVVFDADFYQAAFPQLLQQECQRQSGMVPVVELRLADGTTLDICHVLRFDERWIAVSFFRDLETCEDMDIAILPFELVVRVTISFHDPKSRRIGFTVPQTVQPSGLGKS